MPPYLMEVIEISSDDDSVGPFESTTPLSDVQSFSPQNSTDARNPNGPSSLSLPMAADSPSAPAPEDASQTKRYPGVELNGHTAAEPPSSTASYRETEDDLVSYEEYFYSTEPGCYVKEVTRNPEDVNKKIPSFKCDMCLKRVSGNIQFMDHLQGHFFKSICVKGSEELIDLCRFCLRRFPTPHDMQMHVVRAHFGLTSDLAQCRICEQTFEDEYMFAFHLRECHPPRDMPYVCEACRFRTSSYAAFADHFRLEHANTNLLYCMFCLTLYRLREINTRKSLFYSISYIRHLRNHFTQVRAGGSRSCAKCRLTFDASDGLKTHEAKAHKGKLFKHGVREDKLHGSRKINSKTLHLLRFPERLEHMRCLECSRSMSLSAHYRSYRQCTRVGCGYATCCFFNFKAHGEFAHRSFDVVAAMGPSYRGGPPRDRPLSVYLRCECGYRDVYGDSMAHHLAVCDFCEGPRASIVLREPRSRKVNHKKFMLVAPKDELLRYMNIRRLVRKNTSAS